MNSTFIMLVPKKNHPTKACDLHLIKLVISTYKIISEVLCLRLNEVHDIMISIHQSVFIGDRQFLNTSNRQ